MLHMLSCVHVRLFCNRVAFGCVRTVRAQGVNRRAYWHIGWWERRGQPVRGSVSLSCPERSVEVRQKSRRTARHYALETHINTQEKHDFIKSNVCYNDHNINSIHDRGYDYFLFSCFDSSKSSRQQGFKLKTELASLCTLPAGADGELGFDLGGMQRVILRDQERLEGGTIHKQSHCRELDVQHVVMPFFITHLRREMCISDLVYTQAALDQSFACVFRRTVFISCLVIWKR